MLAKIIAGEHEGLIFRVGYPPPLRYEIATPDPPISGLIRANLDEIPLVTFRRTPYRLTRIRYDDMAIYYPAAWK